MKGTNFWQTILEFSWHGNLPLLLGSVAILSLLLYRFGAESRETLKKTLTFLLFSLAGLFVGGVFAALDYPTVAKILYATFIFAQGAAVIRLIGLFFFRIVLSLLHARPPGILEETIIFIAYFIWVMVLLYQAGLNLGEIVTTSAVATAVLAFAMQDTLGNILGGLALQWDHSLKRGDWIRIDNLEGRIIDIRWRAVLIETRNWETIVIPNGMVMKSHFKVLGERTGEPVQWRRWVWFNVDYSVPPIQVTETVEGAIITAKIPNVASQPAPNCLMMEYEESFARYALRYWLTDLAQDDPTDSMIRQHIFDALRRGGISPAIPSQHLHVTKEGEKFEKRQHLHEIERRIACLSEIDLFSTLTGTEMHELAEHAEFCPFSKGDLITGQGEIDHWFYIVASGQVKICFQRENEPMKEILKLDKGSFFGERGLMTGEPRTASVIAESEVECYRLNKQSFTHVLESRPALVEDISRVLTSRLGALERARQELEKESRAASVAYSHSELSAKIRHFFGLKQ